MCKRCLERSKNRYCDKCSDVMFKRYVTPLRKEHNRAEEYVYCDEVNKKEISDISKGTIRLYLDPTAILPIKNDRSQKIKIILPAFLEIGSVNTPSHENSTLKTEHSTLKRRQYNTLAFTINRSQRD